MERDHLRLTWQRTLRTPSSERFLATLAGEEVAATDLHFLRDGTVAGTVILLRRRNWTEDDIQAVLAGLDEAFLPDVDLRQNNLTFTVVVGDVLGNFDASASQQSE